MWVGSRTPYGTRLYVGMKYEYESSLEVRSTMLIEAFFDPQTFTLTYVVYDGASKDAVVIDPVLDYDPLAVRVSTESVDDVLAFVNAKALEVGAVLETHAHADHLSGAQVLKERLGVPVVIGKSITKVQHVFKDILNLGDRFATDGRQFDKLIADGEKLAVGTLTVEAIHTPGHTPACMTYRIGDALFTGDALFMPDYGTGRCDFPAGSAADLYDSVMQILYAYPDDTRVFVGHDYQPGGRAVACQTTIGASKRENIQLCGATDRATFIDFRTNRDAALEPPRLLFQSVQVNVNGGHLPEAEANGRRYLKLPIGLFD